MRSMKSMKAAQKQSQKCAKKPAQKLALKPVKKIAKKPAQVRILRRVAPPVRARIGQEEECDELQAKGSEGGTTHKALWTVAPHTEKGFYPESSDWTVDMNSFEAKAFRPDSALIPEPEKPDIGRLFVFRMIDIKHLVCVQACDECRGLIF